MKEILEPYLGRSIRIDETYSGMNFEFELFKVEDNYFGINYRLDNKRYIPYSSISEIVEKNNFLTIKIYNPNDFMELMDNIYLTMINDIEPKLDSLNKEMQALKEMTDSVKSNTLNLYVPLGEIMRTSSDIKEKIIERNNKLNSIESTDVKEEIQELNKKMDSLNQSIYSLQNTIKFNSRIL